MQPSQCSHPWWGAHGWMACSGAAVCASEVVCVRGLAQKVGVQVDPLQNVFGHAKNGIHRLDLLVSEQGEACDAEQSVERIHLRR